MKHYKHILFDLDHTLWDFDKNSRETLVELFHTFELASLGSFNCNDFCDTFCTVNQQLWALYNRGAYDQQRLRTERFKLILAELGVAEELVPSALADEYLKLCPTKPHVFPYTAEVLQYLQQRYALHILTNGFSDVQAVKLRSAGLTNFFIEVVSADTIGYQKPSREIFDYVIDKIGASCDECIMIGDNLEADVKGALNAGIDCVFFNPSGTRHQTKTTYEISCLSKLKDIL